MCVWNLISPELFPWINTRKRLKNIYNSLQFLIFLKMFSMESSGACQSISLRSGLREQTTLFLQRAEWLQWVFIVNDKMLWFRKIIFQQSHRNMCFLNHFLWNGVQGLFCPSTQILSHRVLFFSLFIGIYMLLSLTGNYSPTVGVGFYLSGSPSIYNLCVTSPPYNPLHITWGSFTWTSIGFSHRILIPAIFTS